MFTWFNNLFFYFSDDQKRLVSQQSQQSGAGVEKETLFLRIKKTSVLDVALTHKERERERDHNRNYYLKSI